MTTHSDRNWQDWHRQYDDPDSSLSRRLLAVQRRIGTFLDAHMGSLQIVSACAGDGRDLLEVLSDRGAAASRVTARLIETDAGLAARARSFADAHGQQVEVVEDDGGNTSSYVGTVPADLVMFCGIFGNISDDDVRSCIEVLPQLVKPGGRVLWTRGHFDDEDGDRARLFASWFSAGGFTQTAYIEEPGHNYRVVEHRYDGLETPLVPGHQFFTFNR